MVLETGAAAQPNTFLHQDDIHMNHSSVIFKGTNNGLILEKGAILDHSQITFYGDNALVYIKKTYDHHIRIKLDIHTGCTVFMDEGASFNGRLNVVVSEHQNLIVGKDAMFSFDSWIRTSDVHAIYHLERNQRINAGKSIFIGEHVWVGQDVKILKGAMIGSGSVIGAGAVITSTVPNNSIAAGNPAHVIKQDIFWERPSMHAHHPQSSTTPKHPSRSFFFDGVSTQKAWLKQGEALSHASNIREKQNRIEGLYANSTLHCSQKRATSKWWSRHS